MVQVADRVFREKMGTRHTTARLSMWNVYSVDLQGSRKDRAAVSPIVYSSTATNGTQILACAFPHIYLTISCSEKHFDLHNTNRYQYLTTGRAFVKPDALDDVVVKTELGQSREPLQIVDLQHILECQSQSRCLCHDLL